METGKNMSASSQQREHYPDDEISLIDLALVLMRRRWWIIGIFLVCMSAGIAYWQMQTPAQRYLSTLEIGTYVVREQVRPLEMGTYFVRDEIKDIEPREEVVTRLKDSILPRARHDLADELGVSITQLPKVQINLPEGRGGFIFLESESVKENEDLVFRMHKKLIDPTVDYHKSLLESRKNVYKKRMANRIEDARDRLKELLAQQKNFQAGLEQIEEHRSFLTQQEEQVLVLLSSMQGLEQHSLSGQSHDTPLAMSMLIKGSFSVDLQTQLWSIQEELQFGLAEKAQYLQSRLERTSMQIEEAEREIVLREAEKSTALLEFRTTHASAVIMPTEQTGRGGSLILALSMVLGLMLGVFTAFFIEFAAKVRESARLQRD